MVVTGYMNTERSKSTVKELHRRQILNSCSIRHLIEPTEVADLITYLCSDAARHMTGSIIKMDAGEYT
jgi:enoyl-[acyl-carrier-protein] reductase (NADH)